MKTTGNKSVEVFKSANIDADEPTCLITVDGDKNNLETLVLKKRLHYNRRKIALPKRRRQSKAKTTKNRTVNFEKETAAVEKVENDIQHSAPVVDSSEIILQSESDLKTEIKEELETSIQESAATFVNVHIKVEPGDLTFIDQESSDHSNFDFASQSFNSDSDDDKPLIQRNDSKQIVNTQFGHSAQKPMDKFKHIIESAFPVVLVERLQYSEIKSAGIVIKLEKNDYGPVESKGNRKLRKSQKANTRETKAKRQRSQMDSDQQSSLYKCSFCPKNLKTWASLIMHEQIHRNTFDCPTCKLNCSSIVDLIKHAKENPICSRQKHVSLTCTMCDNGVRYRNKAALDYHVTKHTGERPFVCDICSKTVRILN